MNHLHFKVSNILADEKPKPVLAPVIIIVLPFCDGISWTEYPQVSFLVTKGTIPLVLGVNFDIREDWIWFENR